MNHIEQLQANIAPQRNKLLSHAIYKQVNTLEQLQKFAEHHVFAVWDFMSLLKALQVNLTCTTTPWVPVGNPNTRYLINEIVLGEETDVDQFGERYSHYELYLKAMKELGASTEKVEQFVSGIDKSVSIDEQINKLDIAASVKDFLNYTFDIVNNAPSHVIAAVFTFGREDLIPDMFLAFIKELSAEHPEKIATFKYYIERHIEVDGDHHGQLAMQMIEELCGDDKQKWEEATTAAAKSLEMRYQLWDGILAY